MSPLLAGPAAVLGSVSYSKGARLGLEAAIPGATVFAGDKVTTTKDGTLTIRGRSAQIYLLEDSAASLDTSTDQVAVSVERGTVGFSGRAQVTIPGVVVRSKSSNAHGQVQLVRPNELIISNYRGQIEVLAGGEVRTLPAATSYRLVTEPANQGPQGAGASSASHSVLLWTIVGLAVAGGIIGGVVAANTGNEVSPSIP